MSGAGKSRPALRIISGVSHLPTNQNLVHWSTWMRAQSWSERTIQDRVSLIERVARQGQCEPESLSVDDVMAFLSQSSFADTSRQTYHASLKTWFAWLVARGIREDNPMKGLNKPRAGRRDARHLSTAHLQHLLGTRMHRRTRTMILLAAYQGLRVFEIAKFQGTDIDLISRELQVSGKGGVYAILPLHPVIEEEAAHYGSGYWFPQWTGNHENDGHILGASVSSVVSVAMKRAGVPGSAHSLRHWHATELLRSGVDSRVTQQLMRHASLATTQRYMYVDDTQRRAGLLSLPDVTQTERLAA